MNIMLQTDSYKETHWRLYPKDTEIVYSYAESRAGAKFDYSVFNGLQYILLTHLSKPFTMEDIDEAEELLEAHFGNKTYFNRAGWEYILKEHGGKLPIVIRALPEGTIAKVGTPLITIQNTDPKCYWLTNFVETLLSHIWYPTTVATLSREIKVMIKSFLNETAESEAGLPFMLHDFGYRGVTCEEQAQIGGMAHLINFWGTDTIAGMRMARKYYNADIKTLAFSVIASEHSIMTAKGQEGEMGIVKDMLDNYPNDILSVVADSYDIYNFVKQMGSTFKNQILERGKAFVVRPDSVTPAHKTPEELTLWIATQLWQDFGGTINAKGYKVLSDKVRILWGDGIELEGIRKILTILKDNGFSAENMVFGMGGGLLQKVNRDTQRFAFKCSARRANGVWYDVQKNPLDQSKKSKAGRFDTPDLIEVYRDGIVLKTYDFAEIRQRASI